MKKTPAPTNAELDILHVLWDHGTATVREVHEYLTRTKTAQYTTTLKQMQVMTEKGLLKRDDSERSHIYRPAITREQVQRQTAHHVLHRVFRGSAKTLLMEALGAQPASKEELADLKQLLADYEKGRKR
jgi:BlaI family transcriptional regulator, penicillinase repressor